MNEQYSRETILGGMQTKYIGRTVHFYDCIDSTNARGRELAENAAGAECGSDRTAHGHIVVADRQTAGRGRRGRSWESPGGKNIYFTLILKPEFMPDKASMLTLVMAMAVLRGVRTHSNMDLGIKWPNDLVMNGRKICGILTEMNLQKDRIGHVLIGVGINVKRQDFPEELVDKATDLETECGQAFSRATLLQEILKAFEEEYERFLQTEDLSGMMEHYNAGLINRGREVLVLDPKREYTGVAQGINEKGELIVELADGSRTNVYAGEVSVRGICGYV